MGHVWLVGMMGTGKTTVGAIVAEQKELPLYDTDAIVMEMTGRTIPELFAESEEAFRSAERDAVAACAGRDDGVVATGGGAVLDDRNVSLMRRTGRIVALHADPATIGQRITHDGSRPLIADDQDIVEISERRTPLYRDVAEVVIDTSDKDVAAVAEEVIVWLDM